MVELIKQRSNNDCTIACIAMYTGESYETAMGAAEANGFSSSSDIGLEPRQIIRILKFLDFKPVILRYWPTDKRGIFLVQSNSEDGSNAHAVFWEGGEEDDFCLDPGIKDGQSIYTDIKSLGGSATFITECTDHMVARMALYEIEQLEEAIKNAGWKYGIC